MKKTWKPTVAGIMNIAFGLISVFGLIWIVIDYYIDRLYLLDLGMGLAPVIIPFGLVALFCGWLCLSRRWWWLALITSILGIPASLFTFAFVASLLPPETFRLTVPVYPILGTLILITPIVLVFFSRKEFRRQSGVSEVPHGV